MYNILYLYIYLCMIACMQSIYKKFSQVLWIRNSFRDFVNKRKISNRFLYNKINFVSKNMALK